MQSKINIKKYRLQSELENLKLGNETWFKDYVKQVLESPKPYYEKADYIAYSINQVENKRANDKSSRKTINLYG